eukprot:6102196-Prorocentrum_lima.AAC.1
MIRRQQEAIPMERSPDNMWVVSPPGSGLSVLAGRVRDDSSRRGVVIDCSRANQDHFRITQIRMAWITHKTIQQY